MPLCAEAKSACIRRMQARLEVWDQDLCQIVQKKQKDGMPWMRCAYAYVYYGIGHTPLSPTKLESS